MRCRLAFAVIGTLTFGLAPAFGFDGTTSNAPEKIPGNFTDPLQALRVGVDDLKAGDAAGSLPALTYAAEGGQVIARWKLGEMYADGDGVPRDDVKAYHYFNQMVEDYDEDEPDRRNLSAISNAFVAVGVYCLNGVPNSEVRADRGAPMNCSSMRRRSSATRTRNIIWPKCIGSDPAGSPRIALSPCAGWR